MYIDVVTTVGYEGRNINESPFKYCRRYVIILCAPSKRNELLSEKFVKLFAKEYSFINIWFEIKQR